LAIRFQRLKRPKKKDERIPYPEGEPDPVELAWQDDLRVHERLASPLIIKALPLASGEFVPIALWLHRAWPEGKVVLLAKGRTGKKQVVPKSEASFDVLLAHGDDALYLPLRKGTLAEAFFDWLKTRGAGSQEVL